MAANSCRLLVVEDNDADLFLIRQALDDYGILATVTASADGETALRLIDSFEAAAIPNAIILDLSLPRVSGWDVLRNLRDRPAFSGIPVMVFSSSPSPPPHDKHRVELLSNVRYVQKPIGLTNFLRAVGENVKAMLGEGSSSVQSKAP